MGGSCLRLLSMLLFWAFLFCKFGAAHLLYWVAMMLIVFTSSGLLLASVPDFGNPYWLAMAVAVERPTGGVVKLATTFVFGEPEEVENGTEHEASRRTRKSNPLMPAEEV